MYRFAFLIAGYAYSIYFLGLLGFLNKTAVGWATIMFIFSSFYLLREVNLANAIESFSIKLGKLRLYERALLLLIAIQLVVNLCGALAPELSFDALWYHLTIPKIYIQESSIFYIPGGHFHYSAMPKLVEMLYIPSIMFGSEIVAKLMHLAFGVGAVVALYKTARLFVNIRLSLVAVAIFYANLVIGWLSITSYIDLGRTFFEILAFYYFVVFIKEGKVKQLLISSAILGFAISSKILSLGSIIILAPLIYYQTRNVRYPVKFILVSLLFSLPWFVFAFAATGNPIFPLFSDKLNVPIGISIKNIINFVHSSDPISPIYIIVFPLLLIVVGKFNKIEKVVVAYAFLAFIVWFVTPHTGGGRFIAPYLPVFSLLVAITLSRLDVKFIKTFALVLVILLSTVSIIYRSVANYKYVPVLLGSESRKDFLAKNLNYNFGDFYDTDGYLTDKINDTDRVLIIGIHNLYYVNFPFDHESYASSEENYNYILTRGDLSVKYKDWKMIYKNDTTGIALYDKK